MNSYSENARSQESAGQIAGLIFKESRIHGQGVFAGKNFSEGARIIEYIGEKIDKTESKQRCQENNPYVFHLDEEFDLDGNVSWNPARLINHSCAPNCDAEYIDGRIWIVSNRALHSGEEITFNYGYDLEDYRSYPCQCGAPNCVGYIVAEEHFAEIRGAPR